MRLCKRGNVFPPMAKGSAEAMNQHNWLAASCCLLPERQPEKCSKPKAMCTTRPRATVLNTFPLGDWPVAL